MTPRWSITTPTGEYWVRVRRLNEPAHAITFETTRDVWFFAECEIANRSPAAVAAALELCSELTGLPVQVHGYQPDPLLLSELLRTLQGAIQSGRLAFEHAFAPRVRKRCLQSVPMPAGEPMPSSEKSDEDFIEIQLVGEDDQPVGGCAYLVALPNGDERGGKLNSKGFARIDGIPSGQCRVTFPELDAEAWQVA
jgi:hypothetical protein